MIVIASTFTNKYLRTPLYNEAHTTNRLSSVHHSVYVPIKQSPYIHFSIYFQLGWFPSNKNLRWLLNINILTGWLCQFSTFAARPIFPWVPSMGSI